MPPRCAEAKLAATFPRRAERRRDAVKLRSGRRPVRGEQSNATPPTRKRESSRFPAAPNLSLPSQRGGPLRKQGKAAICARAAIKPPHATGQPPQLAAHRTHSKECWPALAERKIANAAVFQRAVILDGERSAAAHRRTTAKQAARPADYRAVPISSSPSHRDGPLRKQGKAAICARAAIKPRTPPLRLRQSRRNNWLLTSPKRRYNPQRVGTHSAECWPALAEREGKS